MMFEKSSFVRLMRRSGLQPAKTMAGLSSQALRKTVGSEIQRPGNVAIFCLRINETIRFNLAVLSSGLYACVRYNPLSELRHKDELTLSRLRDLLLARLDHLTSV